jgi:hypothetical protein
MPFTESSPDTWTQEREQFLQRRICELGLKIEGTRLEPLVQRLYAELDAAGIDFKPKVYLADEWGCPDGVPIIGLPFYLADERLARLEDELMDGIEAESDDEILGYLRHETGHALNYAYRLYETDEWRLLFGPYSRPYREDYEPNPFSRNFVRHIPGWYAQKHPDEDFAETFAVWLNSASNWREVYRDWGCYPKLQYVDRVMREIGHHPPQVTADDFDITGELVCSIAEHYDRMRSRPDELPAYFDGDLAALFDPLDTTGGQGGLPAHEFLRRHRRELVATIGYWTGLNDRHVRSLIAHFIERTEALALWADPADSAGLLLKLGVYATTLCMNKLYKGDFIVR